MRTPEEVVQAWVEAFNRADVEALAALYADNAVNHQVVQEPVESRAASAPCSSASWRKSR